MTYFGETLRKAREAKGLTTSQVAEKTHILVQIINAMEKEDFSRIMAPIYGRGFVKLICECLDIDAKPLVAEFMEIYTGKRPPVSSDPFKPNTNKKNSPAETEPAAIVEAVLPSEPPQASTQEEEEPKEVPPSEEPPSAEPPKEEPPKEELPKDVPPKAEEIVVPREVRGLDLFDPQAMPAAEPPSAYRAQDIFSSQYSDSEPSAKVPSGPSAAEKFRTGLSTVSHGVLGSVQRIPRSAWRIAVLAIGAGIVIALLTWGCVILYRVTEHPIVDDSSESVAKPSENKTVVSTQKADVKAIKGSNAVKSDKATKGANGVKPDKAAEKPKPMRSTGQKVPPLYVD